MSLQSVVIYILHNIPASSEFCLSFESNGGPSSSSFQCDNILDEDAAVSRCHSRQALTLVTMGDWEQQPWQRCVFDERSE